MKYFFFVILVILFSYSCYTSKNKSLCEGYKNGKFIINLDIPPYGYTIIERSDSIQVEINSTTNDTLINRIKWTSPCEYELRFLRRNKIKNDSLTLFLDSKVIKAKILEPHKNFYIFKMYIEGIDFSYIDTLKLISKYVVK
jgi:hypothetical protein